MACACRAHLHRDARPGGPAGAAGRLANAPDWARRGGRLSSRPAHRGGARHVNPKRSAVYPGTFDPITNGHQDLVRRAAGIFDRVVVGIAANPGKAPLFTLAERVELAQKVLSDFRNVTVLGYSGLTADFAREQGCGVVLRGLRAVSDFEFEFQLANMSRHLDREVDYVFMTPQEQFTFISSTMVRELGLYGRGSCRFVDPVVQHAR